MRKIEEVLRLKWQERRSAREIARSVRIGRTTVAQYLARAEAAGLSWPLPEGLDEAALERLLFGEPEPKAARRRCEPDWSAVHRELRGKGATLALVGQEYLERQPEGLRYSQFCAHYARWKGRLDIVMRQCHRAGEKLFVDYAGHTAAVIDGATGEVRQAQVFVAVLGASSYTYAEATWTQGLADWIGALPARPYEYAEWIRARVPPNLHIAVDGHYCSVPHALLKRRLDVRLSASVVEILHQGRRVASHPRSAQRGGYTTVKDHLPEAHRQYLDWTPERLLEEAAKVGPHTRAYVERLLPVRAHPQQGFNAALGVLRLAKTYGEGRLEAACARALAVGADSCRSVAAILDRGLERLPLPAPAPAAAPIDHANVRGSAYYH